MVGGAYWPTAAEQISKCNDCDTVNVTVIELGDGDAVVEGAGSWIRTALIILVALLGAGGLGFLVWKFVLAK
jgi:hypothetical protein